MQAEQGIQRLKEKVDTLIVIPNDRLLTVSNEKTSMVNAFKMADEVLLQGVQGITDLITTPGLINTDFADVKMIMSNAGSALMGIGYGSGEGRSLQAARNAISSPLLEASIEGARGILLTIAGGSDLGLFEVNEAAEVIHGVAHPDANIIFGSIIDDEMGDEVRVTVIAAGFDRWDDRDTSAATRRRHVNGSNRVDDELGRSPRGRRSTTSTSTATTSSTCRPSSSRAAAQRRDDHRGPGPSRVADVALRASGPRPRAPDRVTLVAVTKGFVAPRSWRVRVAGRPRRHRRELRAGAGGQGARAGGPARPARAAGPRWHAIGRLQRNKVRKAGPAGRTLWHSVDHLELVAEIARWAPGAAVLVQVNTAGEAARRLRAGGGAGAGRGPGRAGPRRAGKGHGDGAGRASEGHDRCSGRRDLRDRLGLAELDGDDRRLRGGARRGRHHRRAGRGLFGRAQVGAGRHQG